MSKLGTCKTCTKEVAVSARTCPHCGVSRPVKKKASKTQIIITIIACLFVGMCSIVTMSAPSSSTSSQKPYQSASGPQPDGSHCLSGWDGSHPDLKRRVKSGLKDPKSFKHVETRVTPNQGGAHRIYMTYRATNGFGAVTTATASGRFDHQSCTLDSFSPG